MQREVIKEFPAYRILAAQVDWLGRKVIPRDGKVCIMRATRNHGEMPYLFSPGNVMEFAIKDNRCPIKALEKAKAKGEPIYWLNPCSVMLSANPRPQEAIDLIEVGEVYVYLGKAFRVERDGHYHLKLVEVDMAEAGGRPDPFAGA